MNWDLVITALLLAASVTFFLWLFGWNLKHCCFWETLHAKLATQVGVGGDITVVAQRCAGCGDLRSKIIQGHFNTDDLQPPSHADAEFLKQARISL